MKINTWTGLRTMADKLADEFQSKCDSVRRRRQGRREGGSFKSPSGVDHAENGARRGGEEKEEEELTGPRLSRAPLLPFLSVFSPTEN